MFGCFSVGLFSNAHATAISARKSPDICPKTAFCAAKSRAIGKKHPVNRQFSRGQKTGRRSLRIAFCAEIFATKPTKYCFKLRPPAADTMQEPLIAFAR